MIDILIYITVSYYIHTHTCVCVCIKNRQFYIFSNIFPILSLSIHSMQERKCMREKERYANKSKKIY